MTFEAWKESLATELSKAFKMTTDESVKYIRATGDNCWREAFDDGLTPKEAAAEEAWAAMTPE